MTETISKTRKYQVEIEETLRRVITVEVPEGIGAGYTAISIAQRKYRDEEIVLDADDYVCTSFNLVNDTTKTK